MSEPGMVIVGAGEAGASAAVALREKSWTGAITLLGEQPHAPYELPPLSKAVMTAAEEPSAPTILHESRMREKAIDFRASSPAASIDARKSCVVLDDGEQIPYQKLLLATGARARPLASAGSAKILYLRTFADAQAIRARLQPGAHIGIIGGGFIGLELAASASQRGCRVTVLEMAPAILMRGVPRELADIMEERHRKAGLDLRTGVVFSGFESTSTRQSILLADGSRIDCDAVIAGVGAIPETTLAAASSLQIENGIRVDDQLRTSEPGIFAAGDCCSFPHPLYDGRRIRLEAWRNARDQGAIAAANMLGAGVTYDAVPSFWSDQYELTLRIAGLPDAAATSISRDLGEGLHLTFHLANDGRLVAASSIGPDIRIAKEIRLAEMLIAKRLRPDPKALMSSDVRLKSLLAA
jgi:3-phenylpropionate/trans-cinnamate dioxygenase ferredoxin reductase subunit